MQILNRFNGNVIFEFEADSIKICVEAAIKANANLESANLESANLESANLESANLESANLRLANLRLANLRSTNLRFANLRFANLEFADLRSANLESANLDFSSGLNFSCKTLGIKAGLWLAAQLAYHFCRIDFGDCEDAKAAQKALVNLANQFHRVDECGEIK